MDAPTSTEVGRLDDPHILFGFFGCQHIEVLLELFVFLRQYIGVRHYVIVLFTELLLHFNHVKA